MWNQCCRKAIVGRVESDLDKEPGGRVNDQDITLVGLEGWELA